MLASPWPVVPVSDEILAGGSTQGCQEGQAHDTDSASADANRKYESTLIARAALADMAVHPTAAGEWLATRRNLSLCFASPGALEAWLCRIEGQHV